jgi:hypothetical protein
MFLADLLLDHEDGGSTFAETSVNNRAIYQHISKDSTLYVIRCSLDENNISEKPDVSIFNSEHGGEDCRASHAITA